MSRKPGYKNPNAGRKPIAVRYSLQEKEIVLEQVLYWIGLQATAEEIASSFYVSTDTLDTKLKDHFGMNFSELKKRCDGAGKLSLRRNQFKQSEKNSTMAIWLGKQWLGQRDPDPEPNKNNLPPRELLLQHEDEIIRLRQEIKLLKDKVSPNDT